MKYKDIQELTDEELQQYDAEGLVDLVSGKAHEV